MNHVPHDKLTPGLWYIRTTCEPGYDVVSLTRCFYSTENTKEGELGVWMFDQEGDSDLASFGPEQFICPVLPPF